MKKINKTQFEELLQSGKEFIVDFYAEWCQKCAMLERKLSSIENQYEIYKIDIDVEPELKDLYGIREIPSLLLFQNGKVKKRQGKSTYSFVRELEGNDENESKRYS